MLSSPGELQLRMDLASCSREPRGKPIRSQTCGTPALLWEAVPLLPDVAPSVMSKCFCRQGAGAGSVSQPSALGWGAGCRSSRCPGAPASHHKGLGPCRECPYFSRDSPALPGDAGTRGHRGGFQGFLGTCAALWDFSRFAGNSRSFLEILFPIQELPSASHEFLEPELVSKPSAAHPG